jgi:hypothetical protein
MGPSGGGKSTILRTALRHEGSGVILMAPGDDEYNSYAEFADNDNYALLPFDDPEFLPAAGLKKVGGLVAAMKAATKLRQVLEENPGKYAVLGVDRIDGFAQLAVNVMLKKCDLSEAPKAMSPEGARYYTGLQNLLHQFFRPLRACRGLGAHLLVTSHVMEKEVDKMQLAEAGSTAYMPLIPGSFRNQMPGIFDLTMFAAVNKAGKLVDGRNDVQNPRHYVKWMPSASQPTKSRIGPLSDRDKLPNEWDHLRPLLDAALAEARN